MSAKRCDQSDRQDELQDRDERLQEDILYGVGASDSRKDTRHSVGLRLIAKLTLSFVVPAVYYVSRYRLPQPVPAKLLLIALGIGFQGFLGWYMVRSGLDQEIIDTKGVPRVSQYRLAAHLSAALALYVGMLHTALGLKRDLKVATLSTAGDSGHAAVTRLAEIIASPAVRRFGFLVRVAGVMVFVTAVSGAFVAGLDAGLVYNEFPTMGGRLVPPAEELMDIRYAKASDGRDRWWRNMLENPVTAQFDHRVLVSAPVPLPLMTRLRQPLLSSFPFRSSLVFVYCELALPPFPMLPNVSPTSLQSLHSRKCRLASQLYCILFRSLSPPCIRQAAL